MTMYSGYNIIGGQQLVQEQSKQHLLVLISDCCYTETACIYNYLNSSKPHYPSIWSVSEVLWYMQPLSKHDQLTLNPFISDVTTIDLMN